MTHLSGYKLFNQAARHLEMQGFGLKTTGDLLCFMRSPGAKVAIAVCCTNVSLGLQFIVVGSEAPELMWLETQGQVQQVLDNLLPLVNALEHQKVV